MRVDFDQQLRNPVLRGTGARAAAVTGTAGHAPALSDIVGDFGSLIGVLLLLALVANVFVMFLAEP